MARIVKDESGENIINIDAKVGARGTNSPNDVTVVQGMLKYLTSFSVKWCSVTLPEPNGHLDKNTQQAIFDYQQYVRTRPGQHLIFWVAKDGSISSYKKNVRLLHKQAWTIVAMNNDCGVLSAGLRDGTDHIDAICKRWPYTVGVALGRNNPLFL